MHSALLCAQPQESLTVSAKKAEICFKLNFLLHVLFISSANSSTHNSTLAISDSLWWHCGVWGQMSSATLTRLYIFHTLEWATYPWEEWKYTFYTISGSLLEKGLFLLTLVWHFWVCTLSCASLHPCEMQKENRGTRSSVPVCKLFAAHTTKPVLHLFHLLWSFK